MSRFFIKEEQICGELIRIEGADAHHIARVLRMKEGEELLLCDFFNTEYRTVIRTLSGDFVEAEIVEKRAGASEMPFPVVLYMALPKGDKMEWIIQKAVELGVNAIVPFSSAYTVVKLDEKSAEKKRERWQKIAKSAAEQCGRGIVPEILAVRSFSQALEDCLARGARAPEGGLSFICYEKEEARPLPALLSDHPAPGFIGFFVGSEGGFSEKEVAAALEKAILPVGLGKRILRCETAPLFVLSALCYHYELDGRDA